MAISKEAAAERKMPTVLSMTGPSKSFKMHLGINSIETGIKQK
jgi:hypothetical protein